MMLLLRLVFGLALLSGLFCFALFAYTGHARWRQRGARIVKWTLISAVGVAAGILIEHFLPRLNA
jgi:hypothetical protein